MLYEKLNNLLENYGRGGQRRLAEFLKETPTNVNRYAKGNREIPTSLIPKIAEFFNVTTDFLHGKTDIKPVSRVKIIGTASCGGIDTNHLQDSGGECYYNGEYYKDSLYCVIANGDSMAPEIEDGDEIVCDPDVEPQNGDIVHYTIGSESAVKVYYKDEDAYLLQFIPYNSTPVFKTRTIRLDDDEADEIVISKVVAVNKLKFNNRASRLRLIGK